MDMFHSNVTYLIRNVKEFSRVRQLKKRPVAPTNNDLHILRFHPKLEEYSLSFFVLVHSLIIIGVNFHSVPSSSSSSDSRMGNNSSL